jgi:hypothetical protein
MDPHASTHATHRQAPTGPSLPSPGLLAPPSAPMGGYRRPRQHALAGWSAGGRAPCPFALALIMGRKRYIEAILFFCVSAGRLRSCSWPSALNHSNQRPTCLRLGNPTPGASRITLLAMHGGGGWRLPLFNPASPRTTSRGQSVPRG